MKEFLKKYNFLFIFIILALAFFFRIYQLNITPPGLYPDEAMNGNNAAETANANSPTARYKIFYPENNGREGLFINIQSLSIQAFGNEPWALRLVSAIFGILTVGGLYLLTKEIFKKESIAMLASFFLATSFWHINFSRIGFRAIMAPAFLVWSLWLLWKTADLSNQYRKSIIIGFLSGLIFGLGFHSYIAYRIAPIILLPVFWLLIKNRSFKKGALIILYFSIGAAITILPLAIYFYNNPQDFFGRTSQLSVFSAQSPILEILKNIGKTIGMFFIAGDMNWRHNTAGEPELWWPIAIFFLFGLIISIKKIFKKYEENRMAYVFTPLWLATMLLPVIISSEGIPHALRAIVAAPAAMILAALGMVWLIEKIGVQFDKLFLKFPESARQLERIKKESIILVFVFLTVVSINSYRQYFLIWAGSPYVADAFSKNYTELGNYLKYAPKDTKKYVIVNGDGVEVNGIPMPSQTTMFITNTFSKEKQNEKNIFYVTMKDLDNFIARANQEKSLQIFTLEIDSSLRQKLSDNIPGLIMFEESGVLIQEKQNE